MKAQSFRCRFGKGAARCVLWLALVFSAAPAALAAPHLAPGCVAGAPGQTVAIPLRLTGTAPSSAGFNATIYLPAGVTFTGVVRGSLLPSPGFLLLAQPLADPFVNAVAVLGCSESQVITRTGLLCTLLVAISSNAALGDYPIVLNAPDRSPTVRGSHALSSADGVSSVAHTIGDGVLSVTLNASVAAPKPALVCADYDGDGKADPAFYDAATGTWKVRLSSRGYSLIVTTLNGLGGPGYASVSADYDGDGKADPGVYVEATGDWEVMLSSDGYRTVTALGLLGGLGYSAMPADYDGDAKADPGVYRREEGDWKVMLSLNDYYTVVVLGLLGGTGFLPVAADYDGDRKADPAVYGEDTGEWDVLLSGADYRLYDSYANGWSFGGAGYIPVPADYDGDGKADPAIRGETGNEWIVLLSTAGYTPVYVTIPFE